MKAWFSFDREENTFEFWDTAEEAKEEAENALEYYRAVASDEGWPEEELCVVWGKIEEAPERTGHRTKIEWEKTYDLEDEPWPWPGYDEVYNLQLKPTKEQSDEPD